MLIVIGIVYLIVLCGIIKEKSKVLTWIMILFLLIVFIWCRDNSDYYNYINQFLLISEGAGEQYEVMYRFIIQLAYAIGIQNYDSFKTVISIMELVVLYILIRKKTKSTALVWALYIIIPGFQDAFHTRFFLGAVIIIYALLYLEEQGKKGIPIYMALVCFAALIHNTLFFFLCVPIIFIKKKKNVAIAVIMLISMGIVLRYSGELSIYLQRFIINTNKYETYLLGKSGLGIETVHILVLELFYQTMRLFAVLIIYKIFKKYRSPHLERPQGNIVHSFGKMVWHKYIPIFDNEKFMSFVVKLNYIAYLIVIFETYSVLFGRLYRILHVMNYLAFAVCIDNLKPNSREKFLAKLIAFSYALVFCLIYYLLGSEGAQNSFFEVFYGNSLFNYLIGN